MSCHVTPAHEGRRLLVVSYYFGPDGPVGGLRWAGITRYLSRMGWEIAVLTGGGPGTNGDTSAVQVERCPRLATFRDGCKRVREYAVARWHGPSHNGGLPASPSAAPLAPPRPRRLRREVAALLAYPDESRGWILRAGLRARRLVRHFRPDVVISSGPPHTAHLVAGLATVGSAVRWLADLRDPWAGPLSQAWEEESIAGTGVFRALSPRLERRVFRRVHGLIANTPELAAAVAARYPALAIAHVPNGVDPETLPPPPRERYPGLGIAYAGTLYIGRDLGPVVRALGLFLERHPDAARAGSKLRVAGHAEATHARAFHDAVAAAAMERYVDVLGQVPRAAALDVVRRSRLAVVLAQDQQLQIPAKLYELVAVGVPTLVLAPPHSAAAVEGERLGALVCDASDVPGIAGLLDRLWHNGTSLAPRSTVPITYPAIARLVDGLLSR